MNAEDPGNQQDRDIDTGGGDFVGGDKIGGDKVAGGYIYVHRLLQGYLAELWEQEYGKAE
jgi:hypothetical protein